MRYTHVDLSMLCKIVNEKIHEIGYKDVLMVRANGSMTSIFTTDKSIIKTPLIEDVSRDEGYRYLQGFTTALRLK